MLKSERAFAAESGAETLAAENGVPTFAAGASRAVTRCQEATRWYPQGPGSYTQRAKVNSDRISEALDEPTFDLSKRAERRPRVESFRAHDSLRKLLGIDPLEARELLAGFRRKT